MLVVLGVHCLIGGGQTPILAAGYHALATQFDVSLSKISLTTGVYMLFLGIGSVLLSPTALIYGKRPGISSIACADVVYLLGQLIFLVGCIWCATAPSWAMLLIGRMITGIGVSPCESLPSSSIAEVSPHFISTDKIFFLHERAFRLGIYTMLLLGGKNLVPLVSAAVIQSLGWRWVFIIVGIIVALMFVLTYLFVPETAWDRNPLIPDRLRRKESKLEVTRTRADTKESSSSSASDEKTGATGSDGLESPIPSRVRFAPDIQRPAMSNIQPPSADVVRRSKSEALLPSAVDVRTDMSPARPTNTDRLPRSTSQHSLPRVRSSHSLRRLEKQEYAFQVPEHDIEPIPSSASQRTLSLHDGEAVEEPVEYRFRRKTYRELLAIYQGRISREKWWKSALRPFILFAYPAIAFVLQFMAMADLGNVIVQFKCCLVDRDVGGCGSNLPSRVFIIQKMLM